MISHKPYSKKIKYPLGSKSRHSCRYEAIIISGVSGLSLSYSFSSYNLIFSFLTSLFEKPIIFWGFIHSNVSIKKDYKENLKKIKEFVKENFDKGDIILIQGNWGYTYNLVKWSIEKELIPEKAFREVIANALIHRTWDVNSNIRISMYEDKIEVSSPGGLPSGISEKEYLNGQISQLRNPILANIFFRLKYVEMFGTGIRRINESYKKFAVKPNFEIFENSIKITLPITKTELFLTTDEKIIMDILEKGNILSSSEILEKVEFKKDKLNRILKNLIQKNYIDVLGNGRGTKYLKKWKH